MTQIHTVPPASEKVAFDRGLAIFVGLWSLASALHAAVRGLATLAAFRFVLGLTEPGGWSGAVKTVAERFTPAQRGLVTGIFTSGAGIGALIAPPMIVALTLRYGSRSAFLVCGIAGLARCTLRRNGGAETRGRRNFPHRDRN